MNIRVYIVALLAIISVSILVEDMNEDIGQAIFHNGQYYLIHVYNQINKQYFVPFRQYCQLPQTKCTTMNPKVQQYQQFVEFIGAHKPSYFLIVDALSRRKYIMEDQQITVDTIKQFVDSYHAGTLEAYVSSEQIPKQDSTFVTKLVGKTIFDFVHQNSKDSYKIILFTTDNKQICQNCPEILQDFIALSQKMHSDNRQFGYIDLVKNQHPDINQEVIPIVAVYKDGEQLHVFSKFFVADLEQKIYKLERGQELQEEQSSQEEDFTQYNPQYKGDYHDEFTQGEDIQYNGKTQEQL